jgi:hypothetical protein
LLLPFICFWSQSDNRRFGEREYKLVENNSAVIEVTAAVLCQELLLGWKKNGTATKLGKRYENSYGVPCCFIEKNNLFGNTCCLNLQDIKQTTQENKIQLQGTSMSSESPHYAIPCHFFLCM